MIKQYVGYYLLEPIHIHATRLDGFYKLSKAV